MEGADIYQSTKNSRTKVEMMEKYYASYIKRTLDASSIDVRPLGNGPPIGYTPLCAGVAELADAPDSKSGSARSVGSTPTARTIRSVRLLAYKLPR